MKLQNYIPKKEYAAKLIQLDFVAHSKRSNKKNYINISNIVSVLPAHSVFGKVKTKQTKLAL